MGLDLEYTNGQTPIDEDEKDGLLIHSVTTRGELDEFEQLNIDEANQWLLSKKFIVDKILTETFVKELHKRMFGNVWKWAGQFRTTDKNIGSDKHRISVDLKMLLDDCKYWVNNKTFSEDEIAVRVSHRVVKIHCFANGNGRHSRMIGDILIEKCFGKESFSWGGKNLADISKTRKEYIAALRLADEGNYASLIKFTRS